MSEILGQPSNRGDLRFYKLGGAMMQRPDGLNLVHDELERIGINIWDGAEVRGGQPDSASGSEIAVLRELEDFDIEWVGRFGASIIELDPKASRLHESYLRLAA